MIVLAERPLLSLREVAAWLRVSPLTVRRIVKAGGLPPVRVGGQLRFERTAVEAYIEANRRGG